MTDADYDAQTLATSARIERLHRLRFGHRPCFSARYGAESVIYLYGNGARITFPFYGLSDPEELIYSRAN